MGLDRTFSHTLQAWHSDGARRALLVTGARQTGKTYSVREFAAAHYPSVLEINFVETPAAKSIFDGNLDARTVIAGLTAFSQQPFVPGQTLVFLDEIQECPRARTAIKFLVEDGRFDYIESGSLLGVTTKDVPSLPVGYEQQARMFPLDLGEFLRALNVQPETIELARECYCLRKAVPSAVHERLIGLTRAYLAIGGMPAAVDEFVHSDDLAKVAQVQRAIVTLYRLDVAKYAANRPHVRLIFDAMPSELSKKNKRYKLSDLAPTARMERYASDFMWIVDAGVALPCFNTQAPVEPLALNEQRTLFKLYMSDLGLLSSMFESNVQFEILHGDAGINAGAVLESFVAQELTAHGHRLRYFDKSRYGEVDFVVLVDGKVVPVEVKSASGYRTHKALDNVLAVDEWGIEEGLVLCPGNVERAGKVTYLPWYMVMFL